MATHLPFEGFPSPRDRLPIRPAGPSSGVGDFVALGPTEAVRELSGGWPRRGLRLAYMTDVKGMCEPRFAAVEEALAASLGKDDVGASVAVHLDGEPVVDLWGG